MLIVIYSLIGILLLAIPGYIMRKCGMVGKGGLALLSDLLLFVTTPMLIFVNFQKMPYASELGLNLVWMFCLSLASFAVLGILLIIFVKPQKKGDFSKLFCFGITFANSGYMAIPFLEAIYPGNSVVIMYSAVFVAVFNIALWTLGVFFATGEKKHISLKKAVVNPSAIALFISVPLFVANVRVADFSESIFSSLSSLAVMNTPVSMLVLGIKLADSKMMDILKSGKLYLVSLVKLFAVPIAMFFIFVLPLKNLLDPTLLKMIIILTMMPCAASVTVIFEKFGKDSTDSARYFLLSTCLSVVTIPIMMNLVNWI